MRRKLAATDAGGPIPLSSSAAVVAAGGDPERQNLIQLAAAISAGEDLGPFVRRAFAAGRPEPLVASLRQVSRTKEAEIEELCKAHFHDFIRAVDDLRSLLTDVDGLKSSLSGSNSALLVAGQPLLASLDAYLDARALAENLAFALAATRRCAGLLSLCAGANSHLEAGPSHLYLALRAVNAIDRDLAAGPALPLPSLQRMLLHLIPAIRAHAEREISREFADWLVSIRSAGRHLGQVAISRAAAARQRDEELRSKHRLAEDGEISFSLDLDTDVDDFAAAAASPPDASFSFDLTPLYRSLHIHDTLGLGARFRRFYLENRKLQLTSDFDVIAASPFLESHQLFFSQIAGFFLVEDRVLRTAPDATSRRDVETLWDAAVAKMVTVLEDQFARMQTANHILLITDYVALLAATLSRYGYPVHLLLDVLARHRDKYHDLLLTDCRRQVTEALAADKFDQMFMRKEYEYSMNVLAFQIQTSDITPAFPYVAPFSSTVPDVCRIVRSFIEDSVSFMAHGGGGSDAYAAVKKYLGRILSEVVDSSFLRQVDGGGGNLGVPQAMQIAANMAVMERACDFFVRHAAQLCGLPLRTAEYGRYQFPLKRSRDATEVLLLKLLCAKVDEFMLLTEAVNWVADEPPASGNEYANEVVIYLETLVSTAQQILPPAVLHRVLVGVLAHISDRLVGLFLDDSVKRFNANAVTGIDFDMKLFESFAENMATMFTDFNEGGAHELKLQLVEARQLVNLLMSNNPENFLNPVIREKSYNRLDYKKVVTIVEKFKDSSDRLFSTFGTRGVKVNPKKKSLDALLKRLKEAS